MAQEPTPTPPDSTERAEPSEQADESDWQRRRRLAAVFGEVLPDTTSDEREDAAGGDDDAQDRWLRNQVPPHHG
jgi:hypothetical protein